jgi:hypothetical protein
MLVKLEETRFCDDWEGDGMRPGDNSRSHEWLGQLITIELSEKEQENTFLCQAVKEYNRRQGIDITADDVISAVTKRAAHLTWCSEWKKFHKKVIDYWYVGTDYAPDDRPEVYDTIGNYILIVPTNIDPGDFNALAKVVEEALEEM